MCDVGGLASITSRRSMSMTVPGAVLSWSSVTLDLSRIMSHFRPDVNLKISARGVMGVAVTRPVVAVVRTSKTE